MHWPSILSSSLLHFLAVSSLSHSINKHIFANCWWHHALSLWCIASSGPDCRIFLFVFFALPSLGRCVETLHNLCVRLFAPRLEGLKNAVWYWASDKGWNIPKSDIILPWRLHVYCPKCARGNKQHCWDKICCFRAKETDKLQLIFCFYNNKATSLAVLASPQNCT